MNEQQVFDHVCEHLMKQNEESVGPDGSCLYRNPDGLKCAVGCLIPDEDYDPRMEGNSLVYLLHDFRLPKHIRESRDLLGKMQDLHDHLVPAEWKPSLRRIANDFNLTPPDCILEDRT